MSRIIILLISLLWASLVFISWDGVAKTAPLPNDSSPYTYNQ